MAEKGQNSDVNGTTDVKSLEGKGVLVTGGATGVGAAIVKALANAGAYVTIADSVANEGQRLMLDLINQNKHVQYLHTPLSSFRSQTETFAHASAFPPTGILSLVIISALPSPSSASAADSLLDWLANPPSIPGFPPTLGPPPTAPLDLGVTAVLYSVHLALHHFKAAAGAKADGVKGSGADASLTPRCPETDAQKHQILFLVPRAYVEDGELKPGALASGAAAAGLRAVFHELRRVAAKDVPGLEGVGVRVDLVAVGDGVDGGGGRAEGRGGATKGNIETVLEDEGEDEEMHGACLDAVMRVVCDGSVHGRAWIVSEEGVRDVSI